MLHLQRYFASLAVVLTMLGAYALAIAPWLEPPPPGRRTAAVPTTAIAPSLATQADLARLFSPEAWERQDPKIIEADGCTLLVKDYEPTPDGKLMLTPCTVIFYTADEGDPRRRPIVMQAPQGAVIQFDKKLDIARAEFGRLLGGRLPGDITIFSPETSPGAGDDLHLTTRNIQIDRKRLFTPHDVEFRYGESRGRGRDLTIALMPKDAEDPQSGIGGLRSLTLARIDHLHLETKGTGLLPDLGGDKKAGQSAAQPAPLEVTCQGPFTFDVLTETAMFDEGVKVQRVNPAAPPDTLDCRRLLLVFADEQRSASGGSAGASPSRASPSPASLSQSKESQDPLAGRLKRVIAIGNPATIEAPSSATRASAARIEFSLVKRRLVLLPGQGVEQVSLSRERNQFTARELEYEMAEPGRLGRMWAAGPGELHVQYEMPRPSGMATAVPRVARQTIVARWGRQLRIQSDGPNQVISLIENASIAADPLGRFSGDELHLWVLETRVERTGDRRQEIGDRGQGTFTVVPDRLLASGGVTVDSPRLHVATARLEAWFRNEPPRPGPLPPIDPLEPTSPPRESSAKEPHEGPLRPPALQKFDLAGQTIQMEIIRQGTEMNLENLTIHGGGVLHESATPEPGQKPIHITGQRLELRGGVTGAGEINISGQPAEVGGRGLSLAGSEIRVVRAENRLWIDGPGEAKLPATLGTRSGKQETGDRGALGNALRGTVIGGSAGVSPSQPIHVVWQDGLTFDGLTAEVSGAVQARTATHLATSKTMSVSLSRRVDFADPGTSDEVDVARLAMDGGVFLTSRGLDERGMQQSIEQLSVKDVVLDLTAGTLHAGGPGWGSTTRLASAALPAGLGTRPMPTPPQPDDSTKPPTLINVHIAFEGAIVGDLAKREIEFQRQVRTAFMPVGDWDQQPRIERLEDLGERGALMTSQRLSVVEMTPPGQKPWIEASASGGVIVDGKAFKISAPRIAYTSDKEVLTLEGDGRADAELWYRRNPGQPESYGAARKWRYWLRTGMFDVEDAKPFEFNLQGIDKIRLPGRR